MPWPARQSRVARVRERMRTRRRASPDTQDFVADETTARDAKRGIWRSAFIMPWEWRAHGGPVVGLLSHAR
jgi:endonuclease YncB( thermonuclease family)